MASTPSKAATHTRLAWACQQTWQHVLRRRPAVLSARSGSAVIGGHGGDLLIGGKGADRIVGDASNDIMVGGELLDGALNEDDRYNALNAGLIISPFSASNDGAADKMTGSSGYNIFYGHFSGSGVLDIVTGKKGVLYNV